MNNNNASLTVAFLGLGTMGFPMAGHLANAGFTVRVYNRTFAKAETWTQTYAGSAHKTPALAAEGADIVFTCVGNDQDLESVVLGEEGAVNGLKAGAILVDHTTASANIAQKLHSALEAKGIHFLDAPVSGGQAGAENGVLSVMVGGDASVLERVMPVIDAYSSAVAHMGAPGNGQRAKMVNQICVANILQGLAEGMALAEKTGLDTRTLFETIKHGAAGSWQMANRHEAMAERSFDFGFAVDWMRKDLAIAMAEAEQVGVDLTLTKQIDAFYQDVQALGGGRWDTSSLVARYNTEPNEKK